MPVKLGFIGSFSGPKKELSVNVRDGALLAVENINASGGINGHRIELIAKDDNWDAQKMIKIMQELNKDNVAAVVGPVHSVMCHAALPLAEKAKLVLITPVAPVKELDNVDDYLFRISPPPSETSFATAEYALDRGLRNIAVLYDLTARTYTEPKYQDFKHAFEAGGGRVNSQTFNSDRNVSYPMLAEKLSGLKPDGYFVITSPHDTAMLCQHLRIVDPTRQIFISPWSYHPDLLEDGGRAMEGVVLAHSFSINSRQPAYVKFQEDYFRR